MKKADLYATSQRRLISSLLYRQDDEDAAEVIAPILSAIQVDDFEDLSMAAIYRAINKVISQSNDPGPITIAKELENMGLLTKLGGISALYKLRGEGRKARLEAPIKFYADEVKKGSVRRTVGTELEEVKPFLEPDSGKAVTEVINTLANSLNRELNRMSDDEAVGHVSDSIATYGKLLEERKARSEEHGGEEGGGLQGLITPLPSLNKYTTGWLPEQLITVAARTGLGKSLFAVNCSTTAASAGASVLFFALEMSHDELVDRIISSVTQVSQSRLKTGYVTAEDLEAIEESAEDIENMKIKIDSTPDVTVEAIRAKSMQAAQSKEGLDLIIVDFIQLIRESEGGRRNRATHEIIGNYSREMKLLAKQLGVPVIILSQINRQGTSDEDGSSPSLENISGSDSIAQNSDVVIILDRKKGSGDESEPPKTKVILAKNRNGPANRTITCSSYLSTSTFKEVIKSSDSILESGDVDAIIEDDFEGFDDFDDIGDFDDFE